MELSDEYYMLTLLAAGGRVTGFPGIAPGGGGGGGGPPGPPGGSGGGGGGPPERTGGRGGGGGGGGGMTKNLFQSVLRYARVWVRSSCISDVVGEAYRGSRLAESQ